MDRELTIRTITILMKHLIAPCLVIAALAALSACTTVNDPGKTPSSTTTTSQQTTQAPPVTTTTTETHPN
jgi:hypothetical protein